MCSLFSSHINTQEIEREFLFLEIELFSFLDQGHKSFQFLIFIHVFQWCELVFFLKDTSHEWKKKMFSVAEFNNNKKIYALRRVTWKNVRTQHAHTFRYQHGKHCDPLQTSHSVSIAFNNIVRSFCFERSFELFSALVLCEWRLPIRWKTMSIFHEVFSFNINTYWVSVSVEIDASGRKDALLMLLLRGKNLTSFVWLSVLTGILNIHQKKWILDQN